MNNDQFRKLLDRPKHHQGSSNPTNTSTSSQSSNILGSNSRTSRTSDSKADYAQQFRARNPSTQPTKSFKSFTPRGIKLSTGYIDRAKARESTANTENADDNASRIAALEKQVKLGKLSQTRFEALRDEITGGDLSNTHLVKGLDRKLLEKVRKGEVTTAGEEAKDEDETPVDAEDELDRLAEKEVQSVKKERVEKKGNLSIAGRKRTRDEILAELKAQRAAAKEASRGSMPQLDSNKWKRVDGDQSGRVEIDHKGREVLISVGKDGKVKKMVRQKVSFEQPTSVEKDVHFSKAVASAEHNDESNGKASDDDDDDDIFAGAGIEYNPLGEEPSDDDDDANETNEDVKTDNQAKSTTEVVSSAGDPVTKDVPTTQPSKPRNYFNEDPEEQRQSDERDRLAGLQNILQKAARLGRGRSGDAEDDPVDDHDDDHERAAREARLKKRAEMLGARDRDLDDMDLGFGGSRNDDEEEAASEGVKMRLSEWKTDPADDDDDERGNGGRGEGDGKKKRKPKKRKGDVNNAADIMKVIEGRRANQK